MIWQSGNMKRVLDPELSLSDQILLLVTSSPGNVATAQLQDWTGYKNRAYFLRLLRKMHGNRLVELSADEGQLHILPPGSDRAARIVADRVAK
jgi:hypothetical protein